MDIVAMTPAGSSSKGLPGKIIKNLCAHPLLDYSIKAAYLTLICTITI